jgi:hypothetical protein
MDAPDPIESLFIYFIAMERWYLWSGYTVPNMCQYSQSAWARISLSIPLYKNTSNLQLVTVFPQHFALAKRVLVHHWQ